MPIKLIREVMEEVAPKLEEITGWTADGFERAGIEELRRKDLKWKYLQTRILGTYDFIDDCFRFCFENWESRSLTDQDVKMVVSHELAHRLQVTNNLFLCARIFGHATQYQRTMHPSSERNLDALLALMEGDAVCIDGEMRRRHYPDARQLSALQFEWKELLSKRIRNLKNLYRSTNVIQPIFDAHGREAVNQLYGLEEDELIEKFRGYIPRQKSEIIWAVRYLLRNPRIVIQGSIEQLTESLGKLKGD